MSSDLIDELDLDESPTPPQQKEEVKMTRTGTSATGKGGYSVPEDFKSGRLEGSCAHCGIEMRNILGIMTPDGPVHNDCIPAYRRLHQERCGHCDCVLPAGKRSIVAGIKLHPECVADFKAKKPYVPPTKMGIMRKFAIGRSLLLGSKNWQTRFFFLSKETGLAYWEAKEDKDSGKGAKNSVVFDVRTRLITHPTRLNHPEATNPSRHFIIVFFDSLSSTKELNLLCECKDWQEHDEWTKTLETYIKIIDDPRDVREIP